MEILHSLMMAATIGILMFTATVMKIILKG